MKKYIPYEKMSKKAKRAIDQMARKSWRSIKPVTRIADTSAAYRNRKKNQPDI